MRELNVIELQEVNGGGLLTNLLGTTVDTGAEVGKGLYGIVQPVAEPLGEGALDAGESLAGALGGILHNLI